MPVESMRLLDSYSTYRSAISLSCKLVKQCQPFAEEIVGGDKVKLSALKSFYCELHEYVQRIESGGVAAPPEEAAPVAAAPVAPAPIPAPPGGASGGDPRKCFSKVSLITFDDEGGDAAVPRPARAPAAEVDKIIDLDSLYEASKSATGTVVRANADNMYCLRVSPTNPFAVALADGAEEHVIQL